MAVVSMSAVESEADTSLTSRARAQLALVPSVVGTVFRNRELRRVEIAFAGFNAAEWGVWIAMIVYAYGRGGTTTAGIVAFAQLAPAAIFAPFASALGDRHRPGRVLLWGYVAQAGAMGLVAVVLLADGPPLLAYAFAAVAATAVTITRPTMSALLPSVARRPRELTAANVVTGWVESLTVLVAPAAAGVILGVAGAGWVFAVMSAIVAVSALLVQPVPGPPPAGGDAAVKGGIVSATTDSWRAIRDDPFIRLLVLGLGIGCVALGALDVLYAELALGEFGLGQGWPGYLNAAFGLGGVLGIVVTASLVGRRRLAPALVAGLGVWFASFVLIAFQPTVAGALVLLVIGGAGKVLFDVTGRTLLQRVAPGDLLARVFGALEGISMGALALGSLLAPLFVAIGGAQLAFLVVGGLLPLAAVIGGKRLLTIDQVATVPVVEIGLLRALPLFAPLDAPTLESIARSLVSVEAPPGTAVITQGEVGDRFYIVADGAIRVERGGRAVATLRRGQSFGEVALLHDSLRNATCVAVEPSHLFALEKDDFLEAVTGHPQVREEAESLARDRSRAEPLEHGA